MSESMFQCLNIENWLYNAVWMVNQITKFCITFCGKFQALTRKFQKTFHNFRSYSYPKWPRCHVEYTRHWHLRVKSLLVWNNIKTLIIQKKILRIFNFKLQLLEQKKVYTTCRIVCLNQEIEMLARDSNGSYFQSFIRSKNSCCSHPQKYLQCVWKKTELYEYLWGFIIDIKIISVLQLFTTEVSTILNKSHWFCDNCILMFVA